MTLSPVLTTVFSEAGLDESAQQYVLKLGATTHAVLACLAFTEDAVLTAVAAHHLDTLSDPTSTYTHGWQHGTPPIPHATTAHTHLSQCAEQVVRCEPCWNTPKTVSRQAPPWRRTCVGLVAPRMLRHAALHINLPRRDLDHTSLLALKRVGGDALGWRRRARAPLTRGVTPSPLVQ